MHIASKNSLQRYKREKVIYLFILILVLFHSSEHEVTTRERVSVDRDVETKVKPHCSGAGIWMHSLRAVNHHHVTLSLQVKSEKPSNCLACGNLGAASLASSPCVGKEMEALNHRHQRVKPWRD